MEREANAEANQDDRSRANRRFWAVLFVIVIFSGAALYTFRVTRNPAGFFVDESSIAYNAYTISQTGQDEFGNSWPLFFRAFGDYKNPVYIYLLALLFKLTGPSILTSRLLSAACGVVTAALLGLLATRISRRPDVGLVLAGSALLTPWLFEVSRVSLEVALYPPVLVSFLLFVQRAATKARWTWITVAGLVATLVLLTYTYSIGRLLAPLLALGLVLFISRHRLVPILGTWFLYALSLVPMFFIQRIHADALTGRFKMISYIKPESSAYEIVWTFVKHFCGNLDPRRLLVTGDPNIYQVVHIANTPALLAATFILMLVGLCLVLRYRTREVWWRFVLYGSCISLVPASLTVDHFHMLRLVPLLVFLLVLTVPAIEKLRLGGKRWPRVALMVLLFFTFIQGATFQWRYHTSGNSPWRLHMFDADFPRVIFANAVAQPSRPIYFAEPAPTAYIQAYWYAALNKLPITDFVPLKPDEAPPKGAIVISTESDCYHPHVLAQVEPYTLYVVDREPPPRVPLPESAMRAEISVSNLPVTLRPNEKLRINVHLKNLGNLGWPGCDRNVGLNVSLGGRWLKAGSEFDPRSGGRTPLPADLGPGQEADLIFILDAPRGPGEYTLELDMLQEGVAWFGSKGSKTWRGKVTVR